MTKQEANDKNPRHILTPRGVVSYPYLDRASEYQKGAGNAQYSAVLIFPPKVQNSEEYKALLRLCVKVATEEFGANAAEDLMGGKIKLPFRPNKFDPQDELPEQYPEGSKYIRCGRKESWGKPGLRNWNLDEVDAKDIYAGCEARFHVTCYPWNVKGRRGISFGLNHVQKTNEGERMDIGTVSVAAEDAFSKTDAPDPKDLNDLPGAAEHREITETDVAGVMDAI